MLTPPAHISNTDWCIKIVVATKPDFAGDDSTTANAAGVKIFANHAYSIVAADLNSGLELHNPWGYDHVTVDSEKILEVLDPLLYYIGPDYGIGPT